MRGHESLHGSTPFEGQAVPMTLRQPHDLTPMLSDTPGNLNSGVDMGIRITTV